MRNSSRTRANYYFTISAMFTLRPTAPAQRPRTSKHQSGLTILELLIAMFIISVLGMVALPAFQDYRVRTAVTRDFALVHKAQVAIQEYYAINHKLPSNNTQVAMDEYFGFSDGRFNLKLLIYNSWMGSEPTILLIYNTEEIPELDGWETLAFYATESNGMLSWDCKLGGSMPNKYRPANCRN
jgi:type IV pilus assembly protein PilA